MHVDWSVNVSSVFTIGAAAIALLWKASQFVEEFRSLCRDFNEHARDDESRFTRIETRLEDLRELAKKPLWLPASIADNQTTS